MNALSSLREGASFHEARDWRHPLGVYNISIGRVCAKIRKCAERLEIYWNTPKDSENVRDEIIDALELALYAAAEHVDDVEHIALTFFSKNKIAHKSRDIINLKNKIKPLRDKIATFANKMKHEHARIRLFEISFKQTKNKISLLGFFFEGFSNGQLAPHAIIHSGGKTIISITSFLWSILTYVGEISRALEAFLLKINAVNNQCLMHLDPAAFREAATRLARLPLYSFDDEHPFERVRWRLHMDDEMEKCVDSGIYGSILSPWSKSDCGTFGDFALRYEGDGITKSFKIVGPKALRIQHWE